MSKNKENTEGQQVVEGGTPTPFDDLLKNGTAILTAQNREELAELVNEIPAETKYMAGAIGKTPEGTFTLRVDLIKE